MNLKVIKIYFLFIISLFGCKKASKESLPVPECKAEPSIGYYCRGYDYNPVCGCDSVTYMNSCEAGKYVKTHISKPCNSSYFTDTTIFLGFKGFKNKNGKVFNLELNGSYFDSNAWYRKDNDRYNNVNKKIILTLLRIRNGYNEELYFAESKIVGANCGEDIFEPVCGSDSITYVNSCYADFLKKTYVLGYCKCSIGLDSLTYLKDASFIKSNGDTITYSRKNNTDDTQYSFSKYISGQKYQKEYIRARDDYFEYYYLK